MCSGIREMMNHPVAVVLQHGFVCCFSLAPLMPRVEPQPPPGCVRCPHLLPPVLRGNAVEMILSVQTLRKAPPGRVCTGSRDGDRALCATSLGRLAHLWQHRPPHDACDDAHSAPGSFLDCTQQRSYDTEDLPRGAARTCERLRRGLRPRLRPGPGDYSWRNGGVRVRGAQQTLSSTKDKPAPSRRPKGRQGPPQEARQQGRRHGRHASQVPLRERKRLRMSAREHRRCARHLPGCRVGPSAVSTRFGEVWPWDSVVGGDPDVEFRPRGALSSSKSATVA